MPKAFKFNESIAQAFSEMADLLDLEDANTFRVRAYRQAANTIRSLGYSLEDKPKEKIKELHGIGDDLAEKIIEYQKTNQIKAINRERNKFPAGVLEILHIPGIGPKTAKIFFNELGISSIAELEKSAHSGDLESLPGIKSKTVENILEGIRYVREKSNERRPYREARAAADRIIKQLKTSPEINQIEVAGSLRRRRPTIGDIDILATSSDPEKTMQTFTNHPHTDKIIGHGKTKSSIRLKNGLQVDLRIVPSDSWGAALLYFTGSKGHNIRLRHLAQKQNWKLNEYGLFDSSDHRLAGHTEESIYQKLGLKYIKPEDREE